MEAVKQGHAELLIAPPLTLCFNGSHARELCEYLAETPVFQGLYVVNTDARQTLPIAKAFGDLLRRQQYIKSLTWQTSHIGDSALCALGRWLTDMTPLQQLMLPKNDIQFLSQDMSSFMQGLGHLRRLDLSHNRIPMQGAIRLADTIWQHKSSLEFLDLSFNSIRDEGAKRIAWHLERKPGYPVQESLRELRLQSCGLTDVSVALLAVEIENSHLHTLALEHNDVRQRGASFLKSAVTHNTSLAYVGLEGNPIPDKRVLHHIESLCQERTRLKAMGDKENEFKNEKEEMLSWHCAPGGHVFRQSGYCDDIDYCFVRDDALQSTT